MKKMLSLLLVLLLAMSAMVVPAMAEPAAGHVIITSIEDRIAIARKRQIFA